MRRDGPGRPRPGSWDAPWRAGRRCRRPRPRGRWRGRWPQARSPRPARPRQHQVGDDPDAAGAIAPREKVKYSRRREQRDRRGAHDPRQRRAPGPGRHLQAEDDAHRGEQPERVPVGDRVAEPVVGEVERDRPDVGQKPRRHSDRADRRRSPPPDPRRATEAARLPPDRQPEQHQRGEVEQRAVELEQRAGGRVRPGPREQRPDGEGGQRPRGQRERRAQPGEGLLGEARSSPRGASRKHDRHQPLGVGEIPARVEGEVDDERPSTRAGAPDRRRRAKSLRGTAASESGGLVLVVGVAIPGARLHPVRDHAEHLRVESLSPPKITAMSRDSFSFGARHNPPLPSLKKESPLAPVYR